MNTEIRTLQQLERDLEAVASREHRRLAKAGRGGGGSGRPGRGGGGHGWMGVAAALVAVLVLAGGIGVLSQGSSGDSESSGGADSGSVADELPAAPNATGAPATAGGSGGGGQTEDRASFENADEQSATLGEDGALGWSVRGDGGGGVSGIGAVPGAQGDLTKIIRDGRIGLVIADGSFSKGVAGVTQIAKRNGGFVLESSSRDERSGALTLRVPAKRFDDAMLALRGLAEHLKGQVEFQDISGQDVTAEFIDLGARLEILQDRRDLLRDIQADATSSSEILRLGALIDEVTLQIENIQGRLNFLKDQVAEATIRVEVRERDVERDDPGADPENPSIGDSFELAVQGFLRIVGAIVVGLGYLIPLAVIGAIGWAIVMLVRRRGRGAS